MKVRERWHQGEAAAATATAAPAAASAIAAARPSGFAKRLRRSPRRATAAAGPSRSAKRAGRGVERQGGGGTIMGTDAGGRWNWGGEGFPLVAPD